MKLQCIRSLEADVILINKWETKTVMPQLKELRKESLNSTHKLAPIWSGTIQRLN